MNFYDKNASDYRNRTLGVDMSDDYNRFLRHLASHSCILDIGAGSGRDTIYFRKNGHHVIAIDSSIELVKLALDHGIEMKKQDFLTMNFVNQFDGIWACASLLHLKKQDLRNNLFRLHRSLRLNGIFYASFKQGDGENDEADGRFYSYYQLQELIELFHQDDYFRVFDTWSNKDSLNRSHQSWINILAKKRNF